LGMGDCQLRDGLGQTRHMHLVMLMYTALMRQVKHDRALGWAHTRLISIGESCCAVARATLAKTLAWAVKQAQVGMSLPDIQHRLALASILASFCKRPGISTAETRVPASRSLS
ncbi:MAG: hypothetical protein RLZZ387_4124, partial [Chloroflexota bacterium]